jgi:hypothetical protein
MAIPPEKAKHIQIINEERSKALRRSGFIMRADVATASSNIINASDGGFGASIYLGHKEGVHKIAANGVS